MTIETAVPMTAEQVRARLDEIAPWPGWGSEATPESLARWLAVHAHREWAAHILPFSAPGGPETLDVAAVAKMNGQFAAAHALLAFAGADPAGARLAASQIADAWSDGGGTGEWLFDHLTALGVDPDEVSRLEGARRALPAAPLRAPDRIRQDIALAALRKLASASPVAVNWAFEADTRRRLAARAVEDIEAVTGEAGRGFRVSTHWAVAWGSDDVNDGVGFVEFYDDEEDAREHVPQYEGGSVVRRSVIALPWVTVPSGGMSAVTGEARTEEGTQQ